MDSAGGLTTAISLRRRLEVDVSIMDHARRCAWPVGARRADPAPRTGNARPWTSCGSLGVVARLELVDAWLQVVLSQQSIVHSLGGINSRKVLLWD